jgi:predicted secreted protein
MPQSRNRNILRVIPVFVALCFIHASVQAKYSGGTGEPNDPYQIGTAAELIALGRTPEDYDRHFVVVEDIDLDPNLPGNRIFDRAVIAPDMNDTLSEFQGTAFTGTLDGQGQAIAGLVIDSDVHYAGLFGMVGSSGRVWNLRLVDGSVRGQTYNAEGTAVDGGTGALAGESHGLIMGCWSTVEVKGTGNVGGLVGRNFDGTITGCGSASSVSGSSYVGGLAGDNCYGTITACYRTGSVRGGLCGGGLVGCNDDATIAACYSTGSVGGLVGGNESGTISTCYSTGSVKGTDDHVGGLAGDQSFGTISACFSGGPVSGSGHVGGLVGDIHFGAISSCYSTSPVSGTDWFVGGLVGVNFYSTISSCYSTGSVNGTDAYVGGLVGHNNHATSVASFWDVQTSSQTISDGGIGKTTAEMQTASTFLDAGWDFAGEMANGTENTWKMAEGLDYPRLWWEPYDGQVTLELGQVFAVTLESNPSTGYRWEWVVSGQSILEQIGEAEFKQPETGGAPLIGAGGWEIFAFKAVSPGQMILKLVYRRPWEEGVDPLRTFSLHIVVP